MVILYAIVTSATYLGPTYPPPVDITGSNSLVSVAWKNLTSNLDAYLKPHTNKKKTVDLKGIEDTTFSVGLFSIHDPRAKTFQYHWTSPEIANSKTGTKGVNGDSIYRIASATKLFTVYAGLLTLTEEDWNRPLTQIDSSLAKMVKGKNNPIYHIKWDQITPWALASQSSGISREGWPALDVLYNYTYYALAGLPSENPTTAWGMPPVDMFKLGKCWNATATCSSRDLIEEVDSQAPVFLPWSSPMYANANFILLGMMISKLSGCGMIDIFQKTLFNPLNMTSSSALPPKTKSKLARSVVAGAPEANFLDETPFAIPSGGIFSTTNDMAKLGTSILNHTLLPSTMTRKWMRSVTHTASPTYSIGAPWEVLRYMHPETGKITDLYTKLGDSGFYGSNIVLIPEYEAGFSILHAGTNKTRSKASRIILDHVTNLILPALEAQAAAEATRNFVGTYESTNPNLNSSVTVAFNKSTVVTSRSGLSITKWISNGTDVLASSQFAGGRPRILPSILKQTPHGEIGQVAFQISLLRQLPSYFAPGAAQLQSIGPFTGQYATNADWLLADAAHYGGVGINLFVFDVDQNGEAKAVSPAVAKVKLKKK